MIADKDYFLNKDGNLAESDEDAAFLLVRKGQEISAETAGRYGLGKVAQEGEPVEKAEKKSAAPSENKSAKPTRNKGVK